MNFYKHHIGDYAQATLHLSFVEDAAYSRMIRKYYAEERPLPPEIRAVQRIVGARTKEEKQAVEDVLNEFFELREDGWHNKRCDAELAASSELEAEREAKAANERERQKRHREERSKLFERLREFDIVPAYDTKTETLRSLLSNAESHKPVTRDSTPMSQLVTPPVTRNATANQTPDARHQTPDTNIKTTEEEVDTSQAEKTKPPPPQIDYSMNQRFPMHEAWVPSGNFDTLAKIAGLPIGEDTPVDSLMEFKAYWITHPDKHRTQGEWEHAFIKSLKAEKLKGGKK